MTPPDDNRPDEAPQPEDVDLVIDDVAHSPEPEDEGTPPAAPGPWHMVMKSITQGSALTSLLSVVLAVLVGSVMIVFTDEDVTESLGYFFARPADFFSSAWAAIEGAYTALFLGSIFNYEADTFELQIRPLTETLKFAGPLIAGGLGVGLAFRAGLFNIGGKGQMLLAGGAAGWVAINANLTGPMLMLASIAAAIVAGSLWAGIAGLLKARTGAHEVIVTIMLNYIAVNLLLYALSSQSILQAPNSFNPKSLPMPQDARLPKIAGEQYNLHLGFLLGLICVVVVWVILNHSALGYRFRAVGENPNAARASGINVGRTYLAAMLIAGGLMGVAGANQVLGTVPAGVGTDLDAGIGFDAITVALLGRSRPLGILGAGLLFGAFKAGGFKMASAEGIPDDIVVVIQSLIVLFIAAPPLVRALFRLPKEANA